MFGVCKVCLTCNIRMFNIENSQLHELYEKLTSVTCTELKNANSVCYICYSQLLRSQRLSRLARKSQIRLKSLTNSGIEISKNTVLKLNLSPRQNLSITNELSISIISSDVEPTLLPVKKELLKIKKEPVDDVLKNDNFCKPVQTPSSDNIENFEQKQAKQTLKTLHELKGKKTKVRKISMSNAKKQTMIVKKEGEPIINIQLTTPAKCNIACGKEEVFDRLKAAKINEILQNLENLIDKSKSDAVAKYNLECQNIRAYNKTNEKVVRRLPKRRFPWCNRLRALLSSLVGLAKSEQEAASLLKYRASPLFPTGFARMPTLLKMAGCKWTNTIKQEIKLQVYDPAPLTLLEEPHAQVEAQDSAIESLGENMTGLPYITNTFSLNTNAHAIEEP